MEKDKIELANRLLGKIHRIGEEMTSIAMTEEKGILTPEEADEIHNIKISVLRLEKKIQDRVTKEEQKTT